MRIMKNCEENRGGKLWDFEEAFRRQKRGRSYCEGIMRKR